MKAKKLLALLLSLVLIVGLFPASAIATTATPHNTGDPYLHYYETPAANISDDESTGLGAAPLRTYIESATDPFASTELSMTVTEVTPADNTYDGFNNVYKVAFSGLNVPTYTLYDMQDTPATTTKTGYLLGVTMAAAENLTFALGTTAATAATAAADYTYNAETVDMNGAGTTDTDLYFYWDVATLGDKANGYLAVNNNSTTYTLYLLDFSQVVRVGDSTHYAASFDIGDDTAAKGYAYSAVQDDSAYTLPEIGDAGYVAEDGYYFTGWKNGSTVYAGGASATLKKNAENLFTAQWSQFLLADDDGGETPVNSTLAEAKITYNHSAAGTAAAPKTGTVTIAPSAAAEETAVKVFAEEGNTVSYYVDAGETFDLSTGAATATWTPLTANGNTFTGNLDLSGFTVADAADDKDIIYFKVSNANAEEDEAVYYKVTVSLSNVNLASGTVGGLSIFSTGDTPTADLSEVAAGSSLDKATVLEVTALAATGSTLSNLALVSSQSSGNGVSMTYATAAESAGTSALVWKPATGSSANFTATDSFKVGEVVYIQVVNNGALGYFKVKLTASDLKLTEIKLGGNTVAGLDTKGTPQVSANAKITTAMVATEKALTEVVVPVTNPCTIAVKGTAGAYVNYMLLTNAANYASGESFAAAAAADVQLDEDGVGEISITTPIATTDLKLVLSVANKDIKSSTTGATFGYYVIPLKVGTVNVTELKLGGADKLGAAVASESAASAELKQLINLDGGKEITTTVAGNATLEITAANAKSISYQIASSIKDGMTSESALTYPNALDDEGSNKFTADLPELKDDDIIYIKVTNDITGTDGVVSRSVYYAVKIATAEGIDLTEGTLTIPAASDTADSSTDGITYPIQGFKDSDGKALPGGGASSNDAASPAEIYVLVPAEVDDSAITASLVLQGPTTVKKYYTYNSGTGLFGESPINAVEGKLEKSDFSITAGTPVYIGAADEAGTAKISYKLTLKQGDFVVTTAPTDPVQAGKVSVTTTGYAKDSTYYRVYSDYADIMLPTVTDMIANGTKLTAATSEIEADTGDYVVVYNVNTTTWGISHAVDDKTAVLSLTLKDEDNAAVNITADSDDYYLLAADGETKVKAESCANGVAEFKVAQNAPYTVHFKNYAVDSATFTAGGNYSTGTFTVTDGETEASATVTLKEVKSGAVIASAKVKGTDVTLGTPVVANEEGKVTLAEANIGAVTLDYSAATNISDGIKIMETTLDENSTGAAIVLKKLAQAPETGSAIALSGSALNADSVSALANEAGDVYLWVQVTSGDGSAVNNYIIKATVNAPSSDAVITSATVKGKDVTSFDSTKVLAGTDKPTKEAFTAAIAGTVDLTYAEALEAETELTLEVETSSGATWTAEIVKQAEFVDATFNGTNTVTTIYNSKFNGTRFTSADKAGLSTEIRAANAAAQNLYLIVKVTAEDDSSAFYVIKLNVAAARTTAALTGTATIKGVSVDLTSATALEATGKVSTAAGFTATGEVTYASAISTTVPTFVYESKNGETATAVIVTNAATVTDAGVAVGTTFSGSSTALTDSYDDEDEAWKTCNDITSNAAYNQGGTSVAKDGGYAWLLVKVQSESQNPEQDKYYAFKIVIAAGTSTATLEGVTIMGEELDKGEDGKESGLVGYTDTATLTTAGTDFATVTLSWTKANTPTGSGVPVVTGKANVTETNAEGTTTHAAKLVKANLSTGSQVNLETIYAASSSVDLSSATNAMISTTANKTDAGTYWIIFKVAAENGSSKYFPIQVTISPKSDNTSIKNVKLADTVIGEGPYTTGIAATPAATLDLTKSANYTAVTANYGAVNTTLDQHALMSVESDYDAKIEAYLLKKPADLSSVDATATDGSKVYDATVNGSTTTLVTLANTALIGGYSITSGEGGMVWISVKVTPENEGAAVYYVFQVTISPATSNAALEEVAVKGETLGTPSVITSGYTSVALSADNTNTGTVTYANASSTETAYLTYSTEKASGGKVEAKYLDALDTANASFAIGKTVNLTTVFGSATAIADISAKANAVTGIFNAFKKNADGNNEIWLLIKLTSETGSVQYAVYDLTVERKAALSKDATLKSLGYKVAEASETTPVEGFDPATNSYDVVLPIGTDAASVINLVAEANDDAAKVDASTLSYVMENGALTAAVKVTAENGDENTYTVNFSISTSKEESAEGETPEVGAIDIPQGATDVTIKAESAEAVTLTAAAVNSIEESESVEEVKINAKDADVTIPVAAWGNAEVVTVQIVQDNDDVVKDAKALVNKMEGKRVGITMSVDLTDGEGNEIDVSGLEEGKKITISFNHPEEPAEVYYIDKQGEAKMLTKGTEWTWSAEKLTITVDHLTNFFSTMNATDPEIEAVERGTASGAVVPYTVKMNADSDGAWLVTKRYADESSSSYAYTYVNSETNCEVPVLVFEEDDAVELYLVADMSLVVEPESNAKCDWIDITFANNGQ